MRKLLLLSVLMLGASWAVAQNSATHTQSGSTQTAAGSQTVEGCLSSSNGKYTLTDSAGKAYDLMGDTSKLAEHVGHEVKITGTASSGTTASSGSAMGSTSGQSLEVSSVKHVSKTCKSAGAGGAMSH